MEALAQLASRKILRYFSAVCLNAPKLPPYSPELNPMEQVWQMMKQRFLSNRSYKDINTIVEACCSAWKAICESPDIIQTLTQRKWAEI